MPDPLESLIIQVLLLYDLTLYTSKAEAGVTLLKAYGKKLLNSPEVRHVTQLVAIARSFVQDMKLLKPSLTHEFNQHVPLRVAFTFTGIVFIVLTVLYFVFMYFNQQFSLKDRILPQNGPRKKTLYNRCSTFKLNTQKNFREKFQNVIICLILTQLKYHRHLQTFLIKTLTPTLTSQQPLHFHLLLHHPTVKIERT